MSHKRESLLAQIEAGVLDDDVPLASLLQKCIVLGGQAGSEKMRDWARQELNGYQGETVPRYRRIYTGLMAILTNSAGYNAMNQRISAAVFPHQIRDFLDEQGIDLETAVLGGGIGELEALANQGESEHRLMPPWADVVIETLNKYNVGPNTRVQVVYWPLWGAALRGLLVRVRTALAEMIAELIALTPPAQDVPDKAAADQAVQLVITGHRPTIHVTSQHAHSGGTNVAVGPSEGSPVTRVRRGRRHRQPDRQRLWIQRGRQPVRERQPHLPHRPRRHRRGLFNQTELVGTPSQARLDRRGDHYPRRYRRRCRRRACPVHLAGLDALVALTHRLRKSSTRSPQPTRPKCLYTDC